MPHPETDTEKRRRKVKVIGSQNFNSRFELMMKRKTNLELAEFDTVDPAVRIYERK